MGENLEIDQDFEFYMNNIDDDEQFNQNYIDQDGSLNYQLKCNFDKDEPEIKVNQIQTNIKRELKIISIMRPNESDDRDEELLYQNIEEHDEQIKFQDNDNQKMDIQQSIERNDLKSTEKIRIQNKKTKQNDYSSIQVGSDNSPKNKEKQQHLLQSQQVETKNLPNYYGRQFINRIKRKLEQEQDENIKSEMNQKLEKLKKKQKMFTLKSLRDILDEEYFREESKKYLISFDFIHDLMQSDKQQDIRPPIKYAKRMYEGCLNSNKLFYWKDV
ncbi:unnamed protein product [Paramecium sonneborni]|uniref:Uncharacterized protein n=1 Tax=Paramecium sonneborni TaxID=65129 RepID=A0A8S1N5K1_9CILI|nr:unnamed protein product [Paramecium sonneborni]